MSQTAACAGPGSATRVGRRGRRDETTAATQRLPGQDLRALPAAAPVGQRRREPRLRGVSPLPMSPACRCAPRSLRRARASENPLLELCPV